MWSTLFGSFSKSPEPKDSAASLSEESEQVVYLIDGTLRVPYVLPKQHTKNVITLRQWVFDTISRLPLEERVEEYTFKTLPDGYVYWFRNVSNPPASPGGSTAILMKYDPNECRFTGVSDQSATLPLPLLPTLSTPPPSTGTPEPCTPSNSTCAIKTTLFVDDSPMPKRTSKRTRTRKAL